MDLYQAYYEGEELLQAVGIPYSKDVFKHGISVQQIIDKFLENVLDHNNNTVLYESLTLAYPSYIFALAMGAGKTVLIGAIIATEFSMSIEYPDMDFMQNALVFAPGTTIIESLRELSHIPYHFILPPPQYKIFMANLKMSYASERSSEIIAHGRYNLLVTNTEKIILRKQAKRKQSTLLEQEREQLEANRRLRTIASLPKLGIFSDEAHHTYGNKAGEQLKRVRETINHLHTHTRLVCVVNTTGTPYYKKHILKDVVIWYGIVEGIKHNILKSLHDGIREYTISKGEETTVVRAIIRDFYGKYRDVCLPGGQKAKIAFYFNLQDDLDRAKPIIENTLAEVNDSPIVILVNTQRSNKDEIAEFNRLNSPESQK